MKTMKKIVALLLALTFVVALSACGKNKKHQDGVMSVCLASEPDTLDPALNSAVDGATMCVHLFSGLAKWAEGDDGNLEVVADAATELTEPVVNADGTVTYTYTLRDGLKWSDGKDVTANDFAFAWQRAGTAALGADYMYMFEVVKGYSETDTNAQLDVKAVDAKTLQVTLTSNVPYWNQLLAFPCFFPVREDVVSNESWATDPSTYICNGPYVISEWDHNSVIKLKKNENYVDADKVTMEELNFYLSDDANNMLSNFQNGDWQLIDTVPTNEIANLQKDYKDEYHVTGQIGTYYACWNINQDLLPNFSGTADEKERAQEEIRSAISLLLDRNYIVNDIAQAGQVPASSFVAMGIAEPDGTEFYKNAGSSVSTEYAGYFNTAESAFDSNFASAVETLKKYYTYDEASKKFTDFPSITYLYNTDESHKAIGEYIQSALATVGINIQLENQEWNTFLNTRKNGDYGLARNGWIADYSDPISFLDLWTSVSGNNDIQLGKGNAVNLKVYSIDLSKWGYDVKVENGTWAQTYDVLISTIKTCTDETKRYEMMHYAEDLLMSTGCICPIYFYTDIYMLDSDVQGYYESPLGYKYFMYCTYK